VKDFESHTRLTAIKQLVNKDLDKKINTAKELSTEYECPVCTRTARDSRSFMFIDACKHVVCATCHVEILTKSMQEFLVRARCPICRTEYSKVTALDMGNKKVTEQDIRREIHEIIATRATVVVPDSDPDSDSDSD
jgi:hypothetical protein